ncbi:MAG TPA: hypothetical protein VJX69_14730 [Terriglobales bacterium]|nr:hypothetical protein [Terriglobales bacterium]
MRCKFALLVLGCLSLLCPVCVGQGKGSVHGNVFREAAMGLTYEFPEKFSPKVESEIPSRDPTGRERMILALWETLQRSGQPRMAFLYDTKQRSSDRTHDTIALAYIGEVKGMWLSVKDVKIVGPTKVSEPSYDYWRLDLSAPDQVPRYNSAIAITLSDRRVLVVKASAPSQRALDAEVDSLAQMRFDKSQK